MSDDVASDPSAEAVSIARRLKSGLVRHPLRANEIYPTLFAFRGGEVFALCDLAACWADRNNVLRATLTVLAPDEVLLVAEAAESDDDRIASEALDVWRMTASGAGEQMLLPFSYIDGELLWAETGSIGSPSEAAPTIRLQGDIAESLSAGFAAADEPLGLEEARAALKLLAVRVRFASDDNPFLTTQPDDRCPCGSNRDYKNCHGY